MQKTWNLTSSSSGQQVDSHKKVSIVEIHGKLNVDVEMILSGNDFCFRKDIHRRQPCRVGVVGGVNRWLAGFAKSSTRFNCAYVIEVSILLWFNWIICFWSGDNCFYIRSKFVWSSK